MKSMIFKEKLPILKILFEMLGSQRLSKKQEDIKVNITKIF